MRRQSLAALTILSLVIAASGCLNGSHSMEIETTETELIIEENEVEELGFRVLNNYNETLRYNAELRPEDTERDYIEIKQSGELVSEFDLGSARPEDYTSWEHVNINGLHENVDGTAVALELNIYAESQEVSEFNTTETVMVTVMSD